MFQHEITCDVVHITSYVCCSFCVASTFFALTAERIARQTLSPTPLNCTTVLCSVATFYDLRIEHMLPTTAERFKIHAGAWFSVHSSTHALHLLWTMPQQCFPLHRLLIFSFT